MSLFAIKPLNRILAESEGEHALKRTLGPVQLVALGIGAIIGAGLFSLTGIAAAQHAGPAITLSSHSLRSVVRLLVFVTASSRR